MMIGVDKPERAGEKLFSVGAEEVAELENAIVHQL